MSRQSHPHHESWAMPLIVFEWTVIVCGFVAMLVVFMMHG
jgi:hypothetical protein